MPDMDWIRLKKGEGKGKGKGSIPAFREVSKAR